MKNTRLFVSKAFAHWYSAMSGIIGIILMFLGVIFTNQNELIFGGATLAIIIACYSAWRDEYNMTGKLNTELDALKDKLKPNINIEDKTESHDNVFYRIYVKNLSMLDCEVEVRLIAANPPITESPLPNPLQATNFFEKMIRYTIPGGTEMPFDVFRTLPDDKTRIQIQGANHKEKIPLCKRELTVLAHVIGGPSIKKSFVVDNSNSRITFRSTTAIEQR